MCKWWTFFRMSISYRSLCKEILKLWSHQDSGIRWYMSGECINLEKSGGKILIYPERKIVKLIISNISLPVLERDPPCKSSVISWVFGIKRAVKKCSHNYCHSRGRWEYGVQYVIELSQHKMSNINQIKNTQAKK